MKLSVPQFRNPGIVPWLFIVVATLALTALGCWQVQRLFWKQELLQAIERGQQEAPLTTLPADSASLDSLAYRRVAFIGTLDRARYFLRIGIHRDYGNGYYVLSPFTLPTPHGEQPTYLLANRGFVPGTKTEVEKKLAAEQASNPTMLKGILRPAYGPRFFSPKNFPEKNIWSSEDLPAIARMVQRDFVPLIIEVTEEQPAEYGPVPHANHGEIRLRNDHLGYAVTWFGLAITGIIMFGFYCRKKD